MEFGGVPGGSSSSLDASRKLLKYRAADSASATLPPPDAFASADEVDRTEELSAALSESATDAVRLMKMEGGESRGKLSDSGQGGDTGGGGDGIPFMSIV
jgi:hypothetical protein